MHANAWMVNLPHEVTAAPLFSPWPRHDREILMGGMHAGHCSLEILGSPDVSAVGGQVVLEVHRVNVP